MDEPVRLRRSLLFVPGAEPRKLERARAAGADTLLFDLEDAVAPEQKGNARKLVARLVCEEDFGAAELAVRVNAPGTPDFEADVEAVVCAGVRTIMLPKCADPEVLAAAWTRLDTLERQLAIAKDESVRVLALVETAAGVAQALAVGAAPRVDGLCFGHADLALDMGLPEAEPASGVLYHARCTIALAAKACRVAPIDNVCLAVRDEKAVHDDAMLGLRLGFEGKLCIHPMQVRVVNAVYTPTAEQIAYAQRVVSGWEEAQAQGRGVFTLDNKMVDAPLVTAQRRVLARARRAGGLVDK